MYKALGDSNGQRQQQYRALFESEIPNKTLTEIREMTNKSWVLGDDRFRSQIATKIERAVASKLKGGDRKSEKYRNSIINRV